FLEGRGQAGKMRLGARRRSRIGRARSGWNGTQARGMKPPDRIRIRLLGGVEVFRDDRISIPIRLPTKKVYAIVAFLVMSRKQAACAEGSEAAGSGLQAMAVAERLIALDPLREDWQRLALRVHARYRGQHDALAQAKTFETLLRRELDVDPEPETTALVERI